MKALKGLPKFNPTSLEEEVPPMWEEVVKSTKKRRSKNAMQKQKTKKRK